MIQKYLNLQSKPFSMYTLSNKESFAFSNNKKTFTLHCNIHISNNQNIEYIQILIGEKFNFTKTKGCQSSQKESLETKHLFTLHMLVGNQ